MPDTTPEPSYDDILDSAASEYAESAIKEQLAGTLDTTQPEVKPKAEEAVEETPAAPEPKPAVSTTSAELKLMRREAELRKREDALKALLAQTKAAPVETPKAPEPLPNPKLDPAGYLKAIGLDPAEAARVILAQSLGDKVPQEYRDRAAKFTAEAQLEDKLAKMQARIDQFEQAQAQTQAQKRAAEELQEKVKSAKPAPTQPLANELFTKNPGYFAEEVTREIFDDATKRYFTEGPSAQAITAEEAIARIEKRLKAYGFSASSKTDTPAPKTNVRAALQNRSNKHIEDTESFDDIEAQALKAFMAASQG